MRPTSASDFYFLLATTEIWKENVGGYEGKKKIIIKINC
jgi:hypothetical protein